MLLCIEAIMNIILLAFCHNVNPFYKNHLLGNNLLNYKGGFDIMIKMPYKNR